MWLLLGFCILYDHILVLMHISTPVGDPLVEETRAWYFVQEYEISLYGMEFNPALTKR